MEFSCGYVAGENTRAAAMRPDALHSRPSSANVAPTKPQKRRAAGGGDDRADVGGRGGRAGDAVALRAALGAAALCGGLAATPAAARDCATALVLALDVSSSVDASEYALQMQGLAAALRDPSVVETILYPPGSGIMAAAFVWSGFQHQELIADWSWLGDRAAIEAFAQRLATAPRTHDHWPTAIGRAAGYAAALHARNPVSCRRRVVDVSGDGANNDGVGPDWHRERGTFEGITFNGLVIAGADPDPVAYYRAAVLHGPGAFLEVIDTYTDYPPAILRKLLRELQPPFARNETTEPGETMR